MSRDPGICASIFFQQRFLNTLWVYLAAKPIHHQEDLCLRLKVTVNGKISECQGPCGPPSSSPLLGLA